jgi:hypothetical protein
MPVPRPLDGDVFAVLTMRPPYPRVAVGEVLAVARGRPAVVVRAGLPAVSGGGPGPRRGHRSQRCPSGGSVRGEDVRVLSAWAIRESAELEAEGGLDVG